MLRLGCGRGQVVQQRCKLGLALLEVEGIARPPFGSRGEESPVVVDFEFHTGGQPVTVACTGGEGAAQQDVAASM
ncbi:MAG: hypothetical protein KatS3mg072_0204 [Meiothermus sp.]|nr:MAG: hypothetical protein KatS3mg072_0204 [Meiothermus sp.]